MPLAISDIDQSGAEGVASLGDLRRVGTLRSTCTQRLRSVQLKVYSCRVRVRRIGTSGRGLASGLKATCAARRRYAAFAPMRRRAAWCRHVRAPV